MSISIYLVLLIVLLVFNLVFWLLVIWFRILFDCDFGRCCTRRSSDRQEPIGYGNPGFIDHEDLFRPNTIAALMDSPPSYEEALKYDRFGFPVHTTLSTAVATPSPSAARCHDPPTEESSPTAQEESPQRMSESPPSRVAVTRSRSSTASSGVCPLSPIREEEFIDDMPVTVVLDCIGVQASRLLPNCDTKVNLAGGESLHEHSRC